MSEHTKDYFVATGFYGDTIFKVHPVDAYFFQLKKMDIQPQKEIVEDFRLMEGKHVHEFFVPWIWSCRLRLC